MEWSFLSEIWLLSRLVTLTGVNYGTPVSAFRNVWGDAVCRASEEAFRVIRDGNCRQPRPAFVLRRMNASRRRSVYNLRWTLLGLDALRYDALLCRAWETAGRWGVGPDQRPFSASAGGMVAQGPDGNAVAAGHPKIWRLSEAVWPGAPPAADTPCRLVFREGVSLIEKPSMPAFPGGADRAVADKPRFVRAPDFPRLVRSSWNRVQPWLSEASQRYGEAELDGWLAAARCQPAVASWQFGGISRWSSTQERETEYLVVTGSLELPEGPGPVWPLLLAVYWLGLGRHTTEGLGAFDIVPLVFP